MACHIEVCAAGLYATSAHHSELQPGGLGIVRNDTRRCGGTYSPVEFVGLVPVEFVDPSSLSAWNSKETEGAGKTIWHASL